MKEEMKGLDDAIIDNSLYIVNDDYISVNADIMNSTIYIPTEYTMNIPVKDVYIDPNDADVICVNVNTEQVASQTHPDMIYKLPKTMLQNLLNLIKE